MYSPWSINGVIVSPSYCFSNSLNELFKLVETVLVLAVLALNADNNKASSPFNLAYDSPSLSIVTMSATSLNLIFPMPFTLVRTIFLSCFALV